MVSLVVGGKNRVHMRSVVNTVKYIRAYFQFNVRNP
jgi:hypothetical protein